MNEQYFDPADIEQNKVIAALSYLGILFFLPLVACPNSQFGRFHANQALVLFILGIASGIIGLIPIIGWLITLVVGVYSFAMFLYGLINTLQGHAKELPIIGKIRILN